MPRVSAKTAKTAKTVAVKAPVKAKKVKSLSAKLNENLFRIISKDLEETLPAMLSEAFGADADTALTFVQEFVKERFGKVSRTSGYLVFSNENREAAKKQVPAGSKITEVSKKLGEMWRGLSKSDQEAWNAKAKIQNDEKKNSRA